MIRSFRHKGLQRYFSKGDRKGSFAVWVSVNWRITFGFDGGEAVNVNLEDYH